jgi:hypothetical protein
MLHRRGIALWMVVPMVAALGGFASVVQAGDPTPPAGPVGPTMKTLDQIEGRTPVDSLPGSATALYVISAPGSYYLTGNLTGVDGKDGIEISSDNVSIDLSGFTMTGTPASLSGVNVTSPGNDPFGAPLRRKAIDIFNGAATGWGASGIDAWFAAASSLRNLRTTFNGVDGVRLGFGVYRDSQSDENGDDGFEGQVSSIIDNCTFMFNNGRGMYAGAGSKVSNCVLRMNMGVGLSVGEASMVQGCVISGSGLDGLLLARLGYALNNFACGNGISGVGDGIRATSFGCRIESNMVTLNRNGISTDVGNNLIIGNSSRINTVSAYNLIGVNTVGPIITGGAITSTNPWANFDF